MPKRHTPQRRLRAFRIRTVACLAAITFTTAALLITAALVYTTNRLQSSVENTIEAATIRTSVAELEASLLMYQRLSDLYVVTEETELLATRSELAERMQVLVAQLEQSIRTGEERAVLAAAADHLTSYLVERQQLEGRELTLRDIVRQTRPGLTATFGELKTLRQTAQARIEAANDEADEVSRTADRAGVAVLVALALGAIGLTLGVNRYLLHPILSLHQTVTRVRSGETDARVEPEGLRETAELMDGLNEMVETLRQQRENQLVFLAGVAHDLRNPLSALKLGLMALEQHPAEPQRKQLSARLDRQLSRLARMIEDLLDATRIEAGKLELRPEAFDLREVLEDTVQLFAPTSPEHEIKTHMPAEPVVVEGDPVRLTQVFSNLLSNAIKYSPQSRDIEVRLQPGASDILVDVEDHGIGIAEQDLPNIFLPFRRRQSDVPPGASLGLSVVRRIVVAHGGHIEVRSRQGEGSTFCVTIPRVIPPRPASRRDPKSKRYSAEPA